MAYSELTQSWYCTNDADFRAKIAAVRAGIVALGLTRLTGVGEIDMTTCLRPTGINQNIGYDIFTFSDALQATAPVYIKIIYGSIQTVTSAFSGGDSYGLISYKFVVGTSHNGSGDVTLNGKSSPTTPRHCCYDSNVNSNGSNSVTQADLANQILFSGNSGRLTIVFGANGIHNAAFNLSNGNYDNLTYNMPSRTSILNIERSKTSLGVDDGDGIILEHYAPHGGASDNDSKSLYQLYIPFLRANSFAHHYWNMFYPGDASRLTTLAGASIAVIPNYPLEGAVQKNPGVGLRGFLINDFTWGGSPTDIVVYGAEKPYRPISAVLPFVIGRAQGSSRIMVLWE